MAPVNAFRDLIMSLAAVYEQEDRPGARDLVSTMRAGADAVQPQPARPYNLEPVILAASEGATHPAARAVRAAHSVLAWSATGIMDELIPTEVSDLFAVVSLVGPAAPIPSETCRAGLFVQRSGAFYPPHAHSAEETYVMLAGTAEWQVDFGPWRRHGPGDMIHHPSEAPHATRTGTIPILAAWRWSGDIRSETYRMVSNDSDRV